MGRLLNRIGLTTWRRRLIALLVILPIFGITSAEITSQNSFCNSCHIMGPYYDSWRLGSHKNVDCVKCHISPGVTNFLQAKLNGLGQVVDDVLHRTSMKPSASVSQLACMRSGCHDIERVRTTSKSSGSYLFPHDKHMDLEYSGIKVGCSTCHSHVTGEKHFEVNTNVCITCHLLRHDGSATADAGADRQSIIRLSVRDGGTSSTLASVPHGTSPDAGHGQLPPESCTTCHHPPADTIERNGLKINHAEYLSYGASCESCHRGTTAVPAPVESGRCFECHTFGLERLTNTEDMHRVHNEGMHKIECFSCHGAVHHGPSAQAARLDQFDCRRCHTDQHAIQRSTYLHSEADTLKIANGAASVSPMFMAHVDCTSCHVRKQPVSTKPDSGATVAVATAQACDACHKPGLGEQMIPLWQKTTRALYDKVADDLNAISSDSGAGPSDQGQLLEIRKILELVRIDGSWGVHNPRYTQQLLERAREKLGAAKSGGAKPAQTSP